MIRSQLRSLFLFLQTKMMMKMRILVLQAT